MESHTLKIQPDPDFGRLEKVFRRQGEPDRVPFFELFSNIQPDVLDAMGLKGANALPGRPGGEDRVLQGHIDYQFTWVTIISTCGHRISDSRRKSGRKVPMRTG